MRQVIVGKVAVVISLSLLALLTENLAFAGKENRTRTDKAVTIICSPQTGELAIIPNPEDQLEIPLKGKNVHDAYRGIIKSTCRIGDRLVKILIQYGKPSAKGMCGAWPHGFLAVTENEKTIVGDVTFHACSSYTSVHKVTFSKAKGWEICLGREYGTEEICTPETVPRMSVMDGIWEKRSQTDQLK